VVAAFSSASSNGDDHAEYSTSTIRNPCHHLIDTPWQASVFFFDLQASDYYA
jgi:hypothetical protein